MVKKLFILLIALLMLMPAALADNPQVQDDAKILTTMEEMEIIEAIAEIEAKHQIDVVVLTTEDTPTDYSDSMYRIMQYADSFYEEGGYGMGDDFSGVLFMVDMHNRAMWITTSGVMIDVITDAREDDILDRAYNYMRNGEYGEAVMAAVRRIGQYIEQGPPQGQFRYDEETGKRLSGYYNTLTAMDALIAVGAGLAVAGVIVLCVSASYGLKGSTYRYDAANNTSCNIYDSSEQFLRQNVIRTPRSTGTSSGGYRGGGRSGGSGVHRSSSGRSFGGGGRRF